MGKKIIKNKYLRLIISSILAGFIIAISGFALIAMKSINQVAVGGFLQGVCCLIIALIHLKTHNTFLFETFKNKKKSVYFSFLIILLFNVAAIILFSYLLRLIFNFYQPFITAANELADVRGVQVSYYEGKDCVVALSNGIMCGFLVASGTMIYVACPKKYKWFGYLMIVASVTIFVVCGFENMNTNISYIAYALAADPSNIVGTILVFIGNVLGAYLIYRVAKRLKE